MVIDEVQKGSHCAWQIHYHIVFPVKYRKALLCEVVVEIIVDTAHLIPRGLATGWFIDQLFSKWDEWHYAWDLHG
ncbi:MAG: hypothetical protein V3R68_03240 [Gammaproteobacteria bacterium]